MTYVLGYSVWHAVSRRVGGGSSTYCGRWFGKESETATRLPVAATFLCRGCAAHLAKGEPRR